MARAEFVAMGKAEGGGSGWVILSYSPRDKRLVNQWAADHTTTLAGGRPVLVLDMYEHAYHMDYGAAAAKYVDICMEAIKWDNAAKLYDRYPAGSVGAKHRFQLAAAMSNFNEETPVMRIGAIVLLMTIGAFGSPDAAHAQTSCKVCADQQKACMKNYAGPTCKSEYQISMKSCKK